MNDNSLMDDGANVRAKGDYTIFTIAASLKQSAFNVAHAS